MEYSQIKDITLDYCISCLFGSTILVASNIEHLEEIIPYIVTVLDKYYTYNEERCVGRTLVHPHCLHKWIQDKFPSLPFHISTGCFGTEPNSIYGQTFRAKLVRKEAGEGHVPILILFCFLYNTFFVQALPIPFLLFPTTPIRGCTLRERYSSIYGICLLSRMEIKSYYETRMKVVATGCCSLLLCPGKQAHLSQVGRDTWLPSPSLLKAQHKPKQCIILLTY